MQKRTTRITAVRRAAIAGAASTALIAGMIAPAGAQPAENPVMSEAPEAPAASSIENLPQLPGSGPAPEVPEVPELPVTPEVPEIPLLNTGDRVQLGENIRAEDERFLGQVRVDGYEVSLHKQVMLGQEAYPGDPVAVRMQAEGHWKDARLQEMSNIMPAGFVLESVARVTVGEEGENPVILDEGAYEVIEREDGSTEVKVHGIDERVSAGQTYTLDFLYRAPENVGTYEHGGSARFRTDGRAILGDNARSFSADTGGQPIIVKERPVIPEPPVVDPEDPTGSIDWGSIDLGSLGDLSSSSEDEPADEPGETPAQ